MRGKLNKPFFVIFFRRILRSDETALRAFMLDAILSGINDDTLWLHSATAKGSAVAGIQVNMFAPQAHRAVIGVSIAGYTFATLLTDEVLFLSSETHKVVK